MKSKPTLLVILIAIGLMACAPDAAVVSVPTATPAPPTYQQQVRWLVSDWTRAMAEAQALPWIDYSFVVTAKLKQIQQDWRLITPTIRAEMFHHSMSLHQAAFLVGWEDKADAHWRDVEEYGGRLFGDWRLICWRVREFPE